MLFVFEYTSNYFSFDHANPKKILNYLKVVSRAVLQEIFFVLGAWWLHFDTKRKRRHLLRLGKY